MIRSEQIRVSLTENKHRPTEMIAGATLTVDRQFTFPKTHSLDLDGIEKVHQELRARVMHEVYGEVKDDLHKLRGELIARTSDFRLAEDFGNRLLAIIGKMNGEPR